MEKIFILPRPAYTEQIEHSLGKGLILVLTGQRRVGKSYILKALKAEKEKEPTNNIIYIDKEKRDFDSISGYRELNDFIAERYDPERRNFILVDEVQEIAEFEKALRSWRTEGNTEIVVTGSNAYMLGSRLTTLIGGRYRQIYVQPLSYREFLLFHGLHDSDEALAKYIDWGGLPGLTKFTGDQGDMRQYQLDVYNTALLKDVVLQNKVRNVAFLQNLGKFVADNVGKPLSTLNISNYMKSKGENVSPGVVGTYLQYLADAFVLRQVPRFDIHGKRLLETNGKYYFEDTGIRNALAGGSRLADIEKVIENLVYLELRRLGYEVQVGQLRAGEVDFVCTRPGKSDRVYIQVAYLLDSAATIEREYDALRRINDHYPKYVVSATPLLQHGNDDGIVHLPLRSFLAQGL